MGRADEAAIRDYGAEIEAGWGTDAMARDIEAAYRQMWHGFLTRAFIQEEHGLKIHATKEALACPA